MVRVQIRNQKEAGKIWSAIMFSRNILWKFIGWIILLVTYGNKGYRLWRVTHRKLFVNTEGEIYRYVCGNK